VSYAAICLLVTGRGWVIATVAALLGGIGAFCGAITNVLVGIDLAAAATARTSPDAAARFLVTAFNSGAGQLFTPRHSRLGDLSSLPGWRPGGSR